MFSLLSKKKSKAFRGHFENEGIEEALKNDLVERFKSFNKSNIVFVCVGTDRSTGDSLGPLIGTYLKEMALQNVFVYGDIYENVNAMTLHQQVENINHNHKDDLIVGIDACLGQIKSVGYITVENKPLRPGAGVNKVLPSVGEMSISGIVNIGGHMEMMVLNSTRLSTVIDMSKIMAKSIGAALKEIEENKKQTN